MATTPPTDSLRMLPQVEETLRAPELRALETIMERSVLADCVREAIGDLRRRILAGERPCADASEAARAAVEGAVARALGRRFVLVDDNPDAVAVIRRRLGEDGVAYLP